MSGTSTKIKTQAVFNENKSTITNFLELAELPIHQSENTIIQGVVIGTLAQLDNKGYPYVNFVTDQKFQEIRAKSIISISKEDCNRELVLQFELGNAQKPVIMGFLSKTDQEKKVEFHKQVFIEASEEVVLRCGDASITLRNNRVIIRGKDIVSRARRANKIRGGSVQLN